MENKKVNLQNRGMSQDMAISKETPECAFENHNIRIQATADNTLASVTNIQGPTKVSSIELEYINNTHTAMFVEPFIGGEDYILVHNLKYYGGSLSPYNLNTSTEYYITGTVKSIDYSNQTTWTLGSYRNKKILTDATLKYAGEVSYVTDKKHLKEIDSLDDNTTCVIGPVYFNTNVWIKGRNVPNIRVRSMEGILLGTCDCKNFVVVFTKASNYDYIYRIDINDTSYGKDIIPVRVLYKGRLGFKLNSPIESLFYLENENIQKVYFVDGVNIPRVINIITPEERTGILYKDFTTYIENTFSFYPTTKIVPKFSISKKYDTQGSFPAGVIQYFISYYHLNGGETSIITSSSVYDIDFETRGAKADETGGCTFEITLSNLDTSFDYVRVYSAIRTSEQGELQVHIVGDYALTKNAKNAKVSFIDYGINQEALEAQQLFFIGGTPLIASTLTEKDNTLFLGNLQSISNVLSASLQNAILKRNEFYFKADNSNVISIYFDYDGVYSTLGGYSILLKGLPPGKGKTWFKANRNNIVKLPDDIVTKYNINKSNSKIVNSNAQDVYFTNYHYKNAESSILKNLRKKDENRYKCIDIAKNQFSSYYDYARQTIAGHSLYKTFKGGEIYRFGIQFQNKYGQWTNAVWLGDKGCYYYPFRDEENNRIMLNNAIYIIPNEIKNEALKEGFVNYRLLMANPENSNGRKIAAQGVLCPTMFSPGQRAIGSSWSIPSWIMRPRGFLCAHHHFEPTHPNYMNDGSPEIDGYYSYVTLKDSVNREVRYKKEDGTKVYKNPNITSPYYAVDDTPEVLKYLAIHMAVHSGHKLAMKVTKIASSKINTNFYPVEEGEFTVIKYNGNDYYIKDYGINGWNKIYKDLVNWFNANGLDIRFLPSPDIMKKIAVKQFWGEFIKISAIVAACVMAATGAVGAVGGALMAAVTTVFITAFSATGSTAAGIAATTAGITWFCKALKDYSKIDGLSSLGYVQIEEEYVGWDKNKLNKNLLMEKYPNPFNRNGEDTINFISIHPMSNRGYNYSSEVEGESKNFYVDESIVTLHSPEIDGVNNTKLNLRIVGYVPIDTLYADAEILTSTPSYLLNGGVEYTNVLSHRFKDKKGLQKNPCGLYGEYLYVDNAMDNTGGEGDNNKMYINSEKLNIFRVPLWTSSGSLVGANSTTYNKHPKTDSKAEMFTKNNIPAQLLKKRIFNQLNSKNTYYFPTQNQCTYTNLSRIKVAYPENNTTFFTSGGTIYNHSNIYDYLITRQDMSKMSWVLSWPQQTNTNETKYYDTMDKTPPIYNSVRIKFSSEKHAVFDLCSNKINYKELLPIFPRELKYNGLHTTFLPETGVWGSRSDCPNVESCWTTEVNSYFDEGLLIAVGCLYDKDNNPMIVSTEALNQLSTYNKMGIIAASKQGIKPIIICNINFKIKKELPTDSVASEEYRKSQIKEWLKTEFNELLVYDKIEDSIAAFIKFVNKYMDIVDDNNTNAEYISVDSYEAYRITKIVSYDENTYNISQIETSSLNSSNYNDLIFKDSESGTRFKLKDQRITIYKDFPIKYNQRTIPNWTSSDTPSCYLLMGELYKDVANNQLYGGYSDTNNAKLDWIPISNVTPLTDNILQTWGDTYYQRWDCLKTYPTSEDDINQVIDITSFMVESHTNLDGRTDQNRGNFNIMSRPSNFNLMNTVYNSDTSFVYTLESNAELNASIYPNQIAWSLSKNYGALIDSWTNINLLNISKTTYPITKLVNYNNQILALTEHSIDIVSYNNKNFVQTNTSENIELLNSGKVNGMMKLFTSYGTHNKSICITEKGLYFIDDNEKSLICIGSGESGIKKIGMTKLDSWFKNNIIPGIYSFSHQDVFHLEYDNIYKDLYIVNKNTCLIYNENLDAFTSFIDFEDTNFLYNNAGELYSIAHLQSPTIYKMYNGDYNTTYDSKPINYSIEYRVNPEPFADKVFSNVEFIADLGVSTTKPNKDTSKISTKPFDTIHVWNEYQDTLEQPLAFNRNYVSNLQQKFRIWRADIPRDYNSPFHRDRIRNPWIHLKLEKDNITTKNTDKMQLHNVNVSYMI